MSPSVVRLLGLLASLLLLFPGNGFMHSTSTCADNKKESAREVVNRSEGGTVRLTPQYDFVPNTNWSYLWKIFKDKVAEAVVPGAPRYYGSCAGRCELDTTTGALTISGLKLNDTALYTAEVQMNGDLNCTYYDLRVFHRPAVHEGNEGMQPEKKEAESRERRGIIAAVVVITLILVGIVAYKCSPRFQPNQNDGNEEGSPVDMPLLPNASATITEMEPLSNYPEPPDVPGTPARNEGTPFLDSPEPPDVPGTPARNEGTPFLDSTEHPDVPGTDACNVKMHFLDSSKHQDEPGIGDHNDQNQQSMKPTAD